jgi:AcrR family transcriptional regulator
MQNRSIIKHGLILKTATALFIEHGFGHTTLDMVSRSSGAAISSITNFFGEKSQLAAAVLEDVARPLIADVEAASGGHGGVRSAIHAMLSACSDWAIAHPDHLFLIDRLEASISNRDAKFSQWIRQELTATLAKWAAPLVAMQRIAPLSPVQLHAIILGPILDTLRSGTGQPEGEDAIQWLESLTGAAMAVLVRSGRRAKPNRYTESKGIVKKTTSASAVAPAQGNLLLPTQEK